MTVKTGIPKNAVTVLKIFNNYSEISRVSLVEESGLTDTQVRQSIQWLQLHHFTGDSTIVANEETKMYQVTNSPDLIQAYCDRLHAAYVIPILNKIRFIRDRIQKDQTELAL